MELEAARQILLDHSKHPRNKLIGEPQKFEFFGECQNPLCGDHVKIYASLDGEWVRELQMQIKGCTMCTASASLMSEAIKHKSKAEIQKLKRLFEETLLSNRQEWPEGLMFFEAFSHLKVNPARIPCALIPWYALKKIIE